MKFKGGGIRKTTPKIVSLTFITVITNVKLVLAMSKKRTPEQKYQQY